MLTPQQALAKAAFVLPTRSFVKGEVDQAIESAAHVVEAEQFVRGQEHFYLEGQISLALPTEDGGVHVISSSQHPA